MRLFLILEWMDIVKEIVVNIGLVDLEKIIRNADVLRLDKFRYKNTNKLFKFNTKFLATIKSQEYDENLIGVSVKSTS